MDQLAGGIGDLVVGLVACQIKNNRKSRINSQRDRILAGRKYQVTVVRVLARLAEDRVIDRQIRNVARAALRQAENFFPSSYSSALLGRKGRNESKGSKGWGCELDLGRRTRLGRQVDSECGQVPDGQFIDDAVTIPVHPFAYQLDPLHADFVVRRPTVEIAHEGHGAFPLEWPYDKIRAHADHFRSVEGDLARPAITTITTLAVPVVP